MSDQDYVWLSKWSWFAMVKNDGKYVMAARNTDGGGTTYMHREIMFRKSGRRPKTVDHVDRDSLNNCRGNLRAATFRQNAANRKHRGVEYDPQCRLPYRVRIRVGNKRLSFGRFETMREARKVYVREHQRLHGEFSGTLK